MAGPQRLIGLGLALVFGGFILIALSPLLLLGIWHASSDASIGVGGCILVVFIPICFGYGSGVSPELPMLAAAVIMLAAAALAGILSRIRSTIT